MTVTDEELDITQLFDFEVECNWKDPDCQNAAEWFIQTKCCGKDVVLCESHMQTVISGIAESEIFGCQHCCRLGFKSITEWLNIKPL